MAALESSTLTKNAANLAAQLALVESRGREESKGREKPDSRPSTGTVVSATGDYSDFVPSIKATSQHTSGHTSPTQLDDSIPTSQATSRPTTGHTSPRGLEDSTSTSCAASQVPTGQTSPTKLEDTEGAQVETFSHEHEDRNTVNFISDDAREEDFQRATPNESEVLSYSVAEAVEAFEAKTTRTKKSKKNKNNIQHRPSKAHVEKRDRKEIFELRESRIFGWTKCSILGLILIGLCALLYSYRYISECIIIIKI